MNKFDTIIICCICVCISVLFATKIVTNNIEVKQAMQNGYSEKIVEDSRGIPHKIWVKENSEKISH